MAHKSCKQTTQHEKNVDRIATWKHSGMIEVQTIDRIVQERYFQEAVGKGSAQANCKNRR